MPLFIVAAKSIKKANNIIIKYKDKKSYIIEDRRLQNFFFENRYNFNNYDFYHTFEPEGISKVDKSDVIHIKDFAQSVKNFIETDKYLENDSIGKFNVSKSKLKKFTEKLIKLAQYAIENNDDLIGLRD